MGTPRAAGQREQALEGLLKAWVDGELPPTVARRVERYVADDAGARSAVEDYRRISAMIRTAGERLPVPAPAAANALLGARRQEAAERRAVVLLKRIAAVAAIFVVGASLLLVSARAARGPENDAARSAAVELGVSGSAAELDVAQALAWAIDGGGAWREEWR